MVIYTFDGTFDGLLTAAFDSFVRKESPDALLSPDMEHPLFYDRIYEVTADESKSMRVWRKLGKVVSASARSSLAAAFLTDRREFAFDAFCFICRAVTSEKSIENDFSDPHVLAVLKECRRVMGEAHRILQFIRFQKAADGTYFAMVEPLFDVLPMSIKHFSDRFADQRFIIYDRLRNYGFYYDGNEARRMSFTSPDYHVLTGELSDELMDENERLYQSLWRTYFKATAITERSNPRKQRQDMPVRFWKYLTEMQNIP